LDYLHYALFVVSIIGYFPYFLTSWTNKRLVAQNTIAGNWNLSQFDFNHLFSTQVDQILSVLHSCFYSISLWYLLRHYKKPAVSFITQTKHPRLIRNWPLIFSAIHSILVITWTLAIPNRSIYVDKSIFLNDATEVLFFVSFLYVGFNMIIMSSPTIMYDLFMDSPLTAISSKTINNNENYPLLALEQTSSAEGDMKIKKLNTELQLFTLGYIDIIHASLVKCIQQQSFLSADCKLTAISIEVGIPVHHLTHFFNVIKKTSFSDWRNKLRIEYALELMTKGETKIITLEAISLKCGFTSQSTFIRAFKKITGTSPSNYLKSLL
jgi:AraC-like DNA-binding protein